MMPYMQMQRSTAGLSAPRVRAFHPLIRHDPYYPRTLLTTTTFTTITGRPVAPGVRAPGLWLSTWSRFRRAGR